MRTTWTFHSAGQLVFGPGAVTQLGELVRPWQVQRALLVTDRALVSAGLVEQVEAPLREVGIEVVRFDEGAPEPALALAETCISAARQSRADLVVGLGGGSNLDLAKITATLLAHGGTVRDYVGDCRVPGPIGPLVCLPTTAGTGSEVTAASVLTDTEAKVKVGILSNYLRPKLALVDPQLTLTCPPKVTADSGIDALTHAIEAFTAVDNATFPLPPEERTVYQGRHPLADCLAEKAISLVGANLTKAVRNGRDLAAREAMSLGATLAGMAFSNVGVALVHAMEYPVGGAVHCSHGAGNGLLLPFVMRFNTTPRRAEMARIATLLGENTTGLGEKMAAEAAIVAVERLKREIGIPERLRDLGVEREQLSGFAEKAFAIKRILRVNPREVTLEDVLAIYESAW